MSHLITPTNSSDEIFQLNQMEQVVTVLYKHGLVNFSIVQIICLFIDGLARPEKGRVKETVGSYLDNYFPQLCKEVGGSEVFMNHFRHKAIHEFNTLPPFALETTNNPGGPYVREGIIGNQQWKIFNTDRLIADFLEHLRLRRQAAIKVIGSSVS